MDSILLVKSLSSVISQKMSESKQCLQNPTVLLLKMPNSLGRAKFSLMAGKLSPIYYESSAGQTTVT